MNSALPVHCGYITDPHSPSPATFLITSSAMWCQWEELTRVANDTVTSRKRQTSAGRKWRQSESCVREQAGRDNPNLPFTPPLPPISYFILFFLAQSWLARPRVSKLIGSLSSPTTCCETRHWHCGIEIQSSPVCLGDIFGRTIPLNWASQFVRYFLEGQWFVFQTRPVKTNPAQDRFYDHFCRCAGISE